ncbi:MAG: asparagine synthase (glutamine-hydrolyzing) [candidate division KSB1 bacterium]|nr:asparagine synthase (glutamine-hydrolyzing) [candidate division KSB1 bacterium]
MCGIAGLYCENWPEDKKTLLGRMAKVITHRGPDEDGFYWDGRVGLAMRRLSIIDLSSGSQPIFNEDGTIAVVFNGEIYNYREIREELVRRGHRFVTRSDTESIVHAYEEYGHECVTRFNGMWAFAIWDSRRHQLFLSRDRVGIKPLYYYWDGKLFAWGSEIKSILEVPGVKRDLDPLALELFLTYEYIPAPYSIFRWIRKLPPGHNLVFDGREPQLRPFWDPLRPYRELGPVGYEEAVEELRRLVHDSVRLRLIADVPLGVFLSGGIDSSVVTAAMAREASEPVRSFSIGFRESSYNELHYARLVATRYATRHHEAIIEPRAVELVEKLIYHLDEPLGDFSVFPTYLVSQNARQNVKVALSGDGGDELFGGYDTYVADRLAQRYLPIVPGFLWRGVAEPLARALPPTSKKKGVINTYKRFVEGARYPASLHHVRWMIFLSEEDRRQLLSPDLMAQNDEEARFQHIWRYFQEASDLDWLNRDIYVDVRTYLVDDILVKVDRMSMATSLEVRVPLLDYRIVELALRMPAPYKVWKGVRKRILKEAFRDALPTEILTRGKEGFSIPIKNWIRDELRDMVLSVLAPDKLRATGLFNVSYVHRLLDEHMRGVENHSHRLWALFMFMKWRERFA